MKPERQRIAIAEACGWFKTDTGWFMSNGARATADGGPDSPPDYLNDLNAMHEAEGCLGERNYLYTAELERVVGVEEESLSAIVEWAIAHATAAQRAEAFLRAIGKWEGKEGEE